MTAHCCYWHATTHCRAIWKMKNGYVFIYNLLSQQTSSKCPLYFRHYVRLNTEINRENPSQLLYLGVFYTEGSGLILPSHVGNISSIFAQARTPGHWVIKCIVLWVCCILWRRCLSQGTVNIALCDCVPGDGPCPSEVITFYEENVRVAEGVVTSSRLGGKYFGLRYQGVWALMMTNAIFFHLEIWDHWFFGK